jgi:hypothetical protein
MHVSTDVYLTDVDPTGVYEHDACNSFLGILALGVGTPGKELNDEVDVIGRSSRVLGDNYSKFDGSCL